MSLGKILFFIAVALLLLYFFAPDKFNAGREWITDKLKNKPTTSTTQATYFLSNPEYLSEEYEETTTEETTDKDSVQTQNTTQILNPCNWANKGYPDYSGTYKEGQTCNSVPVNQDYECVMNPPTNYDGWVNKLQKTSDPQMKCCISTGYCHWGG